MSYQRYIQGIIYIAVLAWTVILYANHEAIHSSFLKPLSTVTTIVLYVVMAFDLWLWKLPIFRWLVKRPVIEGLWQVNIISNWRDPDTGVVRGPIDGFMVVKQTLSTLHMRLMTAESTSFLIGTEIVCAPDQSYCVSGVYRNEPGFAYRQGSPIHYGALWLQIAHDDPKPKLTGHYWTDRNSAGSMELTNRTSKKYQTFEAAAAAAARR